MICLSGLLVAHNHAFDLRVKSKIVYYIATAIGRFINKLECAIDGAPLQIPSFVANDANSMTDGQTCSGTPLP